MVSRDSMGNVEVLKRGDLQMTSAGTGIRHSEHQHGAKPVHFLQIWALPHTRGLPPKYFTRNFSDADKADKWVRVVAPVGSDGVVAEREAPGPAPVHSAVKLAASILSPGTKLGHTMPATAGERKVYFHVIQRSGYNPGVAKGASVKISGSGADATLSEGDGAYIYGGPGSELTVENVGSIPAEVLLFDVDV
jgi:redox-sensitive bicupin YhaK (pirin superfamily)